MFSAINTSEWRTFRSRNVKSHNRQPVETKGPIHNSQMDSIESCSCSIMCKNMKWIFHKMNGTGSIALEPKIRYNKSVIFGVLLHFAFIFMLFYIFLLLYIFRSPASRREKKNRIFRIQVTRVSIYIRKCGTK